MITPPPAGQNRVRANGAAYDNMLCYHSGIAVQYLWPPLDEIIQRYRPGGFWLDASCCMSI